MAGFIPAIHAFLRQWQLRKTWMPGTRPGMTELFEHPALAQALDASIVRTF